MHTFDRIPKELQERPQWCFAGPEKEPLTLSADGRTYKASVLKPSQWLTFEVCKAHAIAHGLSMGYMLHKDDPYTAIDLDVKDAENCPNSPALWTTQETFERFYYIINFLDSYTEYSKSGKGFHVWVKANLGKGVRGHGVEAYSQERFMICTGNVVIDKPVEDRQLELDQMITRRESGNIVSMEEVDAEADDWYILGQALHAANGDKFLRLWCGDWQAMGFPSQSEADLALMSMFAYYTNSNVQCRSLFRQSALGQREKATRDDKYLNYTLKLIRDRITREKLVNESQIQQAAALALQHIQGGTRRLLNPLHAQQQATDGYPSCHAPLPAQAAISAPVMQEVAQALGEHAWPPGLAGKIAHFIYQSSPRPVKEVSIVATLGLLAGLCGKAWHIPQSGLNIYVILIARSGIGKEALHSGIGMLLAHCSREFPGFASFVDFSEYVSGPALVKGFAERNSFVNVCGEWGRKLRRLSTDDKEGPLSTLRTQMTNLYQKSGPQSVAGGLVYSDKEKNVTLEGSVAYSMIGETTPTTFYESLTESMMEDGFLSRFTMVEYNGPRPALNEHQLTTPDKALLDSLVAISKQAYENNLINESVPVRTSEEVRPIIRDFEIECDREINQTEDEARRQMWNRASLKSLRISSLLAVADNWICPIVQLHHYQWALQLVRMDIRVMERRLNAGDVGTGDDVREKKIFAIILDYLQNEPNASYRIPVGFRSAGIITRSYLQIRVARTASFYRHRLGCAGALDSTLMTMCQNGYLAEPKSGEQGKFTGKVFRILHIPDQS